MKWLTVNEVADRTSLSDQSVRKMFPMHHFGRSVRIWEGDLPNVTGKRAQAFFENDPGLNNLVKDYWGAAAAIEHMNPDPEAEACPIMTGLLVSTVAACRVEHPDWPVIGVEAVFPPVLDFFRAHLPQGGGSKGDELRALILAA